MLTSVSCLYDTDVITAKGAMNYDDSNINIIRATIRINNTVIYAYRVIEYIFFYNPPNVKNFSIDNTRSRIINDRVFLFGSRASE